MSTIGNVAPRDAQLALTRRQTAVIGFGFLLVLPVLLMLNGIVIWRRRNRA